MYDLTELFTDQTKTIRGVEVFATGVHNGKTFNNEDLKEIVESYNEVKDEIKPPVKLGHNNQIPLQSGLPAVGWASNLRKVGEKLVADFEHVPNKVVEMIRNGLFKRVSSEFARYYIDEQGNRHNRIFKGVALLGADIPAVKTLEDVNNLLQGEDTNKQKVEAYTMEINEDNLENFEDEEESEEEETEEVPEEEPEEEDEETEETLTDDEIPDPKQKGGQTLDINELMEACKELSEEEQSGLLSELGIEASEEEYSEEYVTKLESRVETLEGQLVDQEIESYLDEKVQQGVILEKDRGSIKDVIDSFDSEKFEDTSDRLDKVDKLLDGRKAVETEEYTEDGEAPKSTDEQSSEDNEELTDQILNA